MIPRSAFLFTVACVIGVTNIWAEEVAPRPNIVIEDNVIVDNGLGIYVGWSSDWITLIVENRIERNAEGIRIVNRAAYVERNEIVENVIGLQVTPEHHEERVAEVEKVILRGNIFSDNELYAVLNLADVPLLATGNWWGRPEGPQWEGGPSVVEQQSTISYVPFPGAGIVFDPSLLTRAGLVLDLSLTATPPDEGFLASFPVGTLGLSFAAEPPDGGFLVLSSVAPLGVPVFSLRWEIGGIETTLGQAAAPQAYGNLVKGPLESQGWLSSPPWEEGGE